MPNPGGTRQSISTSASEGITFAFLPACGHGRGQRHAQHRLDQVVGEQGLLGAEPLEPGADPLLAGDGLAEQRLEQGLADRRSAPGGGCSESAAR